MWTLFHSWCQILGPEESSFIGKVKCPLNYYTKFKKTLLYRYFWLFVFGFSIYGCGLLAFRIWNKWMKTPVIVSFTASGTPVLDIPFPAITICPETKTRKEVLNFGSFFEELNSSLIFDDEEKYIYYISTSFITKYLTGFSSLIVWLIFAKLLITIQIQYP